MPLKPFVAIPFSGPRAVSDYLRSTCYPFCVSIFRATPKFADVFFLSFASIESPMRRVPVRICVARTRSSNTPRRLPFFHPHVKGLYIAFQTVGSTSVSILLSRVVCVSGCSFPRNCDLSAASTPT
ncbi:hypothetical protein TRVL_06274 [Trypanosoma vivax]|nr:hypothetical protein TRVL_06274 [Trypanosoma vivax]